MAHIKKVVIMLFVITLFSACGPVTPYSSPTFSISTETPFPPTVTPLPKEAYVKLNKPTNIYDPKDPSLPELIIPKNDVMRLDLNWDVAQIEYSYDWWGLSEPQLGYELIKQTNSGYQWNDKPISNEKIEDFLSTINNLHPVQSLLIGIFHTDDYPTWQVELTGVDGNRVLIYAASNENPGYGPWHVIYNGRMYAQYDGSIGIAIGKLFDRENDEFLWKSRYPEYHDDNLVGFVTEGWTNQLWYGFEGLLPISQGFNYHLDQENAQIQGYIVGRYSIGGFGNMIVGKIVSLRSVKVEIDGKQQTCKIEINESFDDYSARWLFSCNLPEKKDGERYRIPISIELGLDNGKNLTTKGDLYGLWENLGNFWVIPPAEEILNAINEDPKARSLLDDTTIYVSKYRGKLDLNSDTVPILSGQLVFLGEAEIDGVNIKYSVFTPFALKDQRFIEFGLSDHELRRFLFDVTNSPVTRRMLALYPDLMLNLWYSTGGSRVKLEFPSLWNDSFISFEAPTSVATCGSITSEGFSLEENPYRKFAFNSDYLWYPWRGGFMDEVSFLLLDDKTIVDQIYLENRWGETGATELDEQWQYLLPSQLNIPKLEPFELIAYSASNNQLTTLFGIDAPVVDMKAYKRFLDLLPVPIEGEKGGYSAANIGLIVMEDGSVKAISCR